MPLSSVKKISSKKATKPLHRPDVEHHHFPNLIHQVQRIRNRLTRVAIVVNKRGEKNTKKPSSSKVPRGMIFKKAFERGNSTEILAKIPHRF